MVGLSLPSARRRAAHRFAQEGLRFRRPAQGHEVGAQAAQRVTEGPRAVLGVLAHDRHPLATDLGRCRVVALGVERVLQAHQAFHDLGRLGAEEAPSDLDGLAVGGLSLRGLPLPPQERPHLLEAGRGLRALAESLLSDRQRLLGQGQAAVVDAELLIGAGHGGQEGRTHLGGGQEIGLDLLRPAVQHLPRRDRVALGPVGSREREQVEHEGGEAVGGVALAGRPTRRDDQAHRRPGEQDEKGRGEGNTPTVPGDELGGAIGESGLSSPDGLAFEMAPNVLGQGFHGDVAPIRLLAQGGEDDGVEVAAQSPAEAGHRPFGHARLCARRPGLAWCFSSGRSAFVTAVLGLSGSSSTTARRTSKVWRDLSR